jgi:uncharacterized Zn-finger protein
MTAPIETLSVETTKISCAGDKDSPHPKVYLTMGDQSSVDCPYCGKRYVLKRACEDALS